MSGEFSATIGRTTAGALGTDTAPNTSEPAATRTFRASVHHGMTGIQMAVCPRLGTTISIQLWVFEPTDGGNTISTGRWYQLGAAATACPTDRLTPIAELVPHGAKVFPQITANTAVEFVGIMEMVG